MGRQEYKYLVPLRQVPVLKRLLAPYTEYDQHSALNPDKNYTVRSIYFDTLRLDFYHDKLAGIKRRKKLRIRGYDALTNDSLLFLEIKRKNGSTISKSRAPVRFEQLSEIIDTGAIEKFEDSLNSVKNGFQDASNFLYHIYSSNLKPTIKIIYEREAFFYKFKKDIRITIDSNLRSTLSVLPDSLFDEENIIHSLSGYAILEVKLSSEIPLWLQDSISILQLTQEAISKYTICIDSHSPYERYLGQSVNARSKYNQHKNYKNWELVRK